MKKTDIMIGIYLLAAIVCLFITLPPGLLDVMLAINITVAFIILLRHCIPMMCLICRHSLQCFFLQQFSG